MKICVVGAGAIGGLMGAKFALAGEDVTLIDQGAHLAAIRDKGLKLLWDGEHIVSNVKATDSLEEAGPQDLVVLAVKAHYLEAVAPKIPHLTGPDTMIMTVQNGIPWWYFHNHGGAFDGRRLNSLDPDGVLAKHIDADRIIGCVVYPAGDVPEPGVIRHVEGDRFPIGELDGSESARVTTLYDVLVKAGFRSRILDDIRSEIWLKAWGNLSFNPISALTHGTLEEICRNPDTRKLAESMMRESQEIAEKLGVTFRHTIEKRIAGAEKRRRPQDLHAPGRRGRAVSGNRGPDRGRPGTGKNYRNAVALHRRRLCLRQAPQQGLDQGGDGHRDSRRRLIDPGGNRFLRVRDKAWRDFVKWCAAGSLGSLPAHPWTVAAYARSLEARYRHPAIVKRIRAISRAHLLSGLAPPDKHPLVKRTLRMIGTRRRHLLAGLFRAEDFLRVPADTAAVSAGSGKKRANAGTQGHSETGSPTPVTRVYLDNIDPL